MDVKPNWYKTEAGKKYRKEYDKKYRQLNKDKRREWATAYRERHKGRLNAHIRDLARKRREKWIKILTELNLVTCSKCGYNKCFAAIDLHHIDPSKKTIRISQLMIRNPTEERLKELIKVIALCSNCHRELHYDHKE